MGPVLFYKYLPQNHVAKHTYIGKEKKEFSIVIRN